LKRVVALAVICFFLISSFAVSVQAQGQFVGSVNSDVYHYPSYSYVTNIKAENKIWFSDAQDTPTPTPLLADYWVTAQASIGGTITGGSGFAYPGSYWEFTITPDQGYQILDVKDNGVSKGAISSYSLTITNDDQNHLIEATFIPIAAPSTSSNQQHTPTPSVPEISNIVFVIILLIPLIIGISLFKNN
jgi:hypothetical protein